MARRMCWLCDRCGEQYYDSTCRLEIVERTYSNLDMHCNSKTILKGMDICPDCKEKLIRFIATGINITHEKADNRFDLQGDRYDKKEE